MKKYIKSSERSERLANIQRGREQRAADANSAAINELKSHLDSFNREYSERIKDVYDTWKQLEQMKEVGRVVDTALGKAALYDREGIQLPVKNMYGQNIYLTRDGHVGERYAIPYGSSVGSYDRALEPNSSFFTVRRSVEANGIIDRLPLVEDAFLALEDEIYSIADAIEE